MTISVILQGTVPLAVVATAGTTVLGAIDPLDQVAEVCEKHKVWMHIDAAVGGALLFSRKHRHRLTGIEKSEGQVYYNTLCQDIHFGECYMCTQNVDSSV